MLGSLRVSDSDSFIIPIKNSRTYKIQKMQKEFRRSSHEMNFLHNKAFPLTLVNAKLYRINFFFIFTLCSSFQQYVPKLYRTTGDIMMVFQAMYKKPISFLSAVCIKTELCGFQGSSLFIILYFRSFM